MPSPVKSRGAGPRPASATLLLLLTAAPLTAGWDEALGSIGWTRASLPITILEGDSAEARALGIVPTAEPLRVQSLIDARRPTLDIVWRDPLSTKRFTLPPGATVFAKERWTGAPVLAGIGTTLWAITGPGDEGYERFPYLLQALADLGATPRFESRRLWAFFDYSYRMRVDVDYFAERWRKSGIAALHVAAWHFHEPDDARDAYLRRLIDACHRNAIQVYAWLELPHVSEKFWTDHPQWREKTATLADAELDWRKLMNLSNRDCFGAVSRDVGALVQRFDWDGVNLAELYFESLQGAADPARFTPMNDDVRASFREKTGRDARTDFASRAFLDFRVELARAMQQEWLAEAASWRKSKPDLDIVLTHVDDRFDERMRDAIGADAAGVLPLLDRQRFTFMIEDPATVWHLGPKRYAEIARRYEPLTPHRERLAVDINVVERYQDVYPAKQQTGVELMQLLRQASSAFPRVALYFENSLLEPDLALLPSATAIATAEDTDGAVTVSSARGAGLRFSGDAEVDGQPWPWQSNGVIWLPSGRHAVRAGKPPAARLVDFNGDVLDLRPIANGVRLRYRSDARAIAIFDRPVIGLGHTVMLAAGEHEVDIRFDAGPVTQSNRP